jgi:putative transposase
VYPVVLIDVPYVKLREGQVANRPIYIALGINCHGERDVLGMWVGAIGEGCGTPTGSFRSIPAAA